MTRRLFTTVALSISFAFMACTLAPPVTVVRPVAAGSMERALRAIVVAATTTDWVPKTISAEAGYVMAERTDPRKSPYRIELLIAPGGAGPLNVKVTPLSRSNGNGNGDEATSLIKAFLAAFDQSLAANR